MDLQDRVVRCGRADDQHLAVEASGAEQRRVEDLGAIRGAEQDDAAGRVEAVEFDEQLVEGLFLLVVATQARHRVAGSTQRIEFIDEDDAGAFCRA